MPNGDLIKSTGAGILTTNTVKIPAHTFNNDDLHTSLLAPADYTKQKCKVLMDDTSAQITDANGALVLEALKRPGEKLWFYNPSISRPQSNNIIRHEIHAEVVTFWHKTLGSQSQSTLIRALTRGWLRTVPRLTPKMVRANPVSAIETALGHLDLTRRNQRSTRPAKSSCTPPPATYAEDEETDDPCSDIITKVTECTNNSDLTGQLPITSRSGNRYILVSVYKNYVYQVPMASKQGTDYVKAYTKVFAHYTQLGIRPRIQKMDNETSTALTNYLREHIADNNHSLTP